MLIWGGMDAEFAVGIVFRMVFWLYLFSKDLGLFWLVFAEIGVESTAINDVSTTPDS